MSPQKVRGKFMTGAKPSPRNRLLAAMPFRPLHDTPPQLAIVPPRLDPWGNEEFGDCVSAEEAYAKADYSLRCGLPELFATRDEVVNFANRYRYLNGAYLTDVMDTMQRNGMSIGGKLYYNGPPAAVDYNSESAVRAALAVGCVKIAIDHSALPQTAGNMQGWYGTGGQPGQFGDTDHCIALNGFGPAGYLYQQLGVPLPNGLPGDKQGFLAFTWGSIGFVDMAWVRSTTVEAWVRNPTTVGQVPVPPSPPSPPPPGPPTPPPTPPAKPVTYSISIGGRVPAFGGPVTLTGLATEVQQKFHATSGGGSDDEWRDRALFVEPPASDAPASDALAGMGWFDVLTLMPQILAFVDWLRNQLHPAAPAAINLPPELLQLILADLGRAIPIIVSGLIAKKKFSDILADLVREFFPTPAPTGA